LYGPNQRTAAHRARIVGSGLIARAFAPFADALPEVCVYAAGVSNSACTDPREFERERERLHAETGTLPASTLLMYFSTCSIGDPALQDSPYVLHKRAMEQSVRQRPRHLILRLPQLAGRTPNPHTLLNYLHARIVRSERFTVFSKAQRNIIDVDDVARIAIALLDEGARAETVNVACSHNFPIRDIVQCMEEVLGHRAIFDIIDAGAGYAIDTSRIGAALARCGISFTPDYLRRTLDKYYGSHGSSAT
jgi:nucleoside-diphosphate-sugar epimerase